MLIAKPKLLKLALVLIGLALVFYFGGRTLESYRQLRFIQEQGLDTGDADVNAIHPWMTIDFIAAAYAVPREYIYAELGITATDGRRDIDVKHLNEELDLGRSKSDDYPAIIDRLRQIILAYHENPVATGLSDLRGWMTLEYIANSTGIPTTTIVDELGLDKLALQAAPSPEAGSNIEVNIHMPLKKLAHELRYPRGPRGLMQDIKAAITRHGQEVQ